MIATFAVWADCKRREGLKKFIWHNRGHKYQQCHWDIQRTCSESKQEAVTAKYIYIYTQIKQIKLNKTEKKNETREDGGLDIWHGM